MAILCHNCGHAVPDGAAFCPECAAPQLRVQAAEPASGEEGASLPPLRHTGEIVWPAALRAAAIYAVPAGLVLSFLAQPIADAFWVVAGVVWALRHYRRRVPRAPILTPELGGRIGLLVGLIAALVCTTADAVSYLVERFGLHQGAVIDARLQSAVQTAIERVRAGNPEAAAQLPGFFRFWLSPDGQGSVVLWSAAVSTVIMLFFAWLGGRYTVRLTVRRRRGA